MTTNYMYISRTVRFLFEKKDGIGVIEEVRRDEASPKRKMEVHTVGASRSKEFTEG